jgi:hypothetical protein
MNQTETAAGSCILLCYLPSPYQISGMEFNFKSNSTLLSHSLAPLSKKKKKLYSRTG